MTQHIFAGETGLSNKSDVDANFTSLYDIRELITTPSYTAGGQRLIIGSDGRLAIGYPSVVVAGANHMLEVQGFNKYLAVIPNTGQAGVTNPSGNGGLFLGWNRSGALGEGNIVWGTGVGSNPVLDFGTWDGTTYTLRLRLGATGGGVPGADNAYAWGTGGTRWSTIYAGTGTINTSDAREKTAITPLTAAEIAASKALADAVGSYKWLSAVQAKGADARMHIGLTVQSAIEVMTAHSLDPMAYGFICYDQWEEKKDEAGNVTEAAGDRYSFRPDELLLFLARGFDARLAALEAR